MGEDDSDEDYSEEEEELTEKNVEKKDLDDKYFEKAGGEEKLPAETLKELDDQEAEEEDFDPFWFCGPPAVVIRVDGQKAAKMWRGEDGEDCGDCDQNWVHHCLQDILVG